MQRSGVGASVELTPAECAQLALNLVKHAQKPLALPGIRGLQDLVQGIRSDRGVFAAADAGLGAVAKNGALAREQAAHVFSRGRREASFLQLRESREGRLQRPT